jgi:hypothetical protein
VIPGCVKLIVGKFRWERNRARCFNSYLIPREYKYEVEMKRRNIMVEEEDEDVLRESAPPSGDLVYIIKFYFNSLFWNMNIYIPLLQIVREAQSFLPPPSIPLSLSGLYNFLYIYPLSVNFSHRGISGSARNIIIEVRVRENDSSVKDFPVFLCGGNNSGIDGVNVSPLNSRIGYVDSDICMGFVIIIRQFISL